MRHPAFRLMDERLAYRKRYRNRIQLTLTPEQERLILEAARMMTEAVQPMSMLVRSRSPQ